MNHHKKLLKLIQCFWLTLNESKRPRISYCQNLKSSHLNQYFVTPPFDALVTTSSVLGDILLAVHVSGSDRIESICEQ